jgi:hypothetical protein
VLPAERETDISDTLRKYFRKIYYEYNQIFMACQAIAQLSHSITTCLQREKSGYFSISVINWKNSLSISENVGELSEM